MTALRVPGRRIDLSGQPYTVSMEVEHVSPLPQRQPVAERARRVVVRFQIVKA